MLIEASLRNEITKGTPWRWNSQQKGFSIRPGQFRWSDDDTRGKKGNGSYMLVVAVPPPAPIGSKTLADSALCLIDDQLMYVGYHEIACQWYLVARP